ncbi:hypothetical protein MLD38_008519 [Melastoma candidum]|uniref:Uncharacterized protein n=1 Tax=Melastoma candidum TaxID=119954 RepID=A0ACB9RUS0_9MYRT|nr:hypothetical protein MLD38_008519 [Melastoma candidum]
MGILPCRSSPPRSRTPSYHLLSESSSSSIASQSSLPSVPSLTLTDPLDVSSWPPTDVQHRCLMTQSSHSSYVSSLVLVGKFFLAGAADGEVRAWAHGSTGSCSSSDGNVAVPGGGSTVKSMAVSGDVLFSAHQDGKIRVWRLDDDDDDDGRPSYKFLTSLPTFVDRFSKIFSSRNYVQVRRHRKCTWVHHVDAVSSLVLSKDGSLLYTASWDRTFKVWRTSDLRCLESVSDAHADAINAIVVSPSGFVYTGSADKKIKMWKQTFDGDRARKGRHVMVATLEKHRSAVNALALTEDGEVLYSGACDRSILVWEWEGSRNDQGMVLAGALRGHSKAILSLAVVGDLVVSGSADKTLRVWRRGVDKAYSCLGVLEGHTKPVKCVAAREDRTSDGRGYRVYSGGLDRDIKVWQIWAPSQL